VKEPTSQIKMELFKERETMPRKASWMFTSCILAVVCFAAGFIYAMNKCPNCGSLNTQHMLDAPLFSDEVRMVPSMVVSDSSVYECLDCHCQFQLAKPLPPNMGSK
jgi:DNA-directed RNA polymerase subunit RPC12/RpoP